MEPDSSSPTSSDIAIIGAGPAGNFVACEAAKKGASVMVFEEHETIGKPVHCGECLSQLACKRLGLNLPDEVISKEVKGIRIIFPDRTSSSIEEKGYVLEKDKFEQQIAILATEAGAFYKLRHRVFALSREAGSWRIKTTGGEYTAKIVIDASGVAGIASKLLQLNAPPKTVVGLQYELSQIENDGFIEFFLWPRLSPHGYLWIIPKKDGGANVGLVTDDAPNTRKYLEQFLEEYRLSEKKRIKAFGGLIPSSGPVSKTYSDGILLTGDAAGFTSPMFEGGTSLAMTSGKFAAQVACEALAEGDTSAAKLSKYEMLWKEEFPNYKKLLSGKNAVYKFSEEELNKISSLIPRDLTDLSLFEQAKIGAKVLFSAPNLIARGWSTMAAFSHSRAEYYGW